MTEVPEENPEYYDRLMAVLNEGVELGLVRLACSTHDGIPMTEAEEVDWEEGIDRCIPIARVFDAEHFEKWS